MLNEPIFILRYVPPPPWDVAEEDEVPAEEDAAEDSEDATEDAAEDAAEDTEDATEDDEAATDDKADADDPVPAVYIPGRSSIKVYFVV